MDTKTPHEVMSNQRLTSFVLCMLVLLLGCGDSVEPIFETVGRIQGQIVYFDDEPPASITIKSYDPNEEPDIIYFRSSSEPAEWQVELDSEGRFDVPVPFGSYTAEFTDRRDEPGSSRNRLFLTPNGFYDRFDPDSVLFQVDNEFPELSFQNELGRLALRVGLPAGVQSTAWALGLRSTARRVDWDRYIREIPQADELAFEANRLPIVDFEAYVDSPFFERVPLALRLDGVPVASMRPTAQALAEYQTELPEPTSYRIRTSAVPGSPLTVLPRVYVYARGLGGLHRAEASMSLDSEGRLVSPVIQVYSNRPSTFEVSGYDFELWAGGPYEENAIVYAPDPGNTVEVEVEAGVLLCSFTPTEGFAYRKHDLEVRDPRTLRRIGGAATGQSVDEENLAALPLSPGTYDLRFIPGDLDSLTFQHHDGTVEIRPGEVTHVEWELKKGASLSGRLGRAWGEGDGMFVLLLDERRDWEAQIELGPDGRDFTVHNIPDGYIVLVHYRRDGAVYYPGAFEDFGAEVIHVVDSQDIDGLVFTR